MSHTFAIAAPRPPSFPDLLDAVGGPNLRSVQPYCRGSSWDGLRWHFYRHGDSARCIEITHSDERFTVTVASPSSDEEYDLAFAFLEAAAQMLDSPVFVNDGPPVPAIDLRSVCNLEWVEQTIDEGVRAILEVVGNGGLVTLDGPVRPFFVGPRLLGELLNDTPREQLPGRLMAVMKAVQYVPPEEYYPAETLFLRCPDDSRASFAVWAEGVRYLFPDVDFLAMLDEVGEPFFVPGSELPQLAGPAFRWLDERQALVEAVDGADWVILLAHARGRRVDLRRSA